MAIPAPPAQVPFTTDNYTSPAWVVWFNQLRNAAAPNYTALKDAANDAAAAALGVKVGELYRTGSAIKVRIA